MKLPLTVILNNVRSLYNVGSVFRTADGVGAEKLWLCGITGHPPEAKISKTALGAEREVPWEHSWKIGEVVQDLRRRGYQIILVERMAESVPYEEFAWKPPVALVLGNENTGVSEGLIERADAVVDIDMAGIKQCLNVTVAFGIVAYHIRKVFSARV